MTKKVPLQFIPDDLVDGYALQALARGDASADQQKRALRLIIEDISGYYRLSYDPQSERQTSFAEGRRSVGHVIVGLLKLNLGLVKKVDERRANPPDRKAKPNG